MTNYLVRQKNKCMQFLLLLFLITPLYSLDIMPQSNRIVFYFEYEEKSYTIKFVGKEEFFVAANLFIDDSISRNDYWFLSQEDILLINEEIKKSQAIDTSMINIYEKFTLNVSYIDDMDAYKRKSVAIIPSTALYSFIIHRLLYIFELPVYIVQKGDTLEEISQKLFGDKNKYELLYDVNPVLTFSNLSIQPGQQIRIPEVLTE